MQSECLVIVSRPYERPVSHCNEITSRDRLCDFHWTIAFEAGKRFVYTRRLYHSRFRKLLIANGNNYMCFLLVQAFGEGIIEEEHRLGEHSS